MVKGGLTSAFRYYGGTYASYANPVESGNGFIYASTPGALSVDTTLASGIASNTYGTAPTAIFGYTISNPTIADNEDLALIAGSPVLTPTISSTTNAGYYTVSYLSGLTSTAGYTFISGTGLPYTVNTAPLTVTANNASKTYNGAAYTGGNGVTYSGFVNSETNAVLGGTLAYSGSSQGAINAGGYFITPGGLTSSNYAIAYTDGALTINKAPLAVTANDASRIFGAANPTFTSTITGYVNGENATTASVSGAPSLTTTADATTPVGTATIVAGAGNLAAANYAFTTFNNGVLTIAVDQAAAQAAADAAAAQAAADAAAQAAADAAAAQAAADAAAAQAAADAAAAQAAADAAAAQAAADAAAAQAAADAAAAQAAADAAAAQAAADAAAAQAAAQAAAPPAPVVQEVIATVLAQTTTATAATTTTTIATATTATASTGTAAAAPSTAPVAIDTAALAGATTMAVTNSAIPTLAGPAGGTIGGAAGTFGGDAVFVTTEPMPAMMPVTEVAAPSPAMDTASASALAPAAESSSSDSSTTSQDNATREDNGAKKESVAKKEDSAKKDDSDSAKKDDDAKKDNKDEKGGKGDKDKDKDKDKPSAKPEKC